jgi:hypothetical protein
MGYMKNAYKSLVGIEKKKRSIGQHNIKMCGLIVCSGFIWLRTESSGGMLCTARWTSEL